MGAWGGGGGLYGPDRRTEHGSSWNRTSGTEVVGFERLGWARAQRIRLIRDTVRVKLTQ